MSGVFGTIDDLGSITDLSGAACRNKTYFTSDELSLKQARELARICTHECPVLEKCRMERDRYRESISWEWNNFTGVWAGQAYTRGRPRRANGN